MYSFLNDYNEIAHPSILEAIAKNNMVQTGGYGEDEFCEKAKEIIKDIFKCPESDIYFFIGGTSANLTAISHILETYEGVVSVDTGHVNGHEAGAIEATGHKVLITKNINGKLDLVDAQKCVDYHVADNHLVLPGAVYISQATEMGTVYKLEELKKIRQFCDKNDLYLFLDGARLAQGLTSKYTDIKPEDIAKYTDLFYIGATKTGSPIGEALVINNKNLGKNFIRHMKQKGSVLAKGKILGICFCELFKDNLFFKLGQHANKMAEKLYESLKDTRVKFSERVESNQIFIEMNEKQINSLREKYDFSIEKILNEEISMVRFVTSWATQEDKVDELIEDLKKI